MDVDQQCVKSREIDLVTIRAEKETARRYEAATWLRNMGATELPGTPSEEEFKSFLKNGILLCNVLNKIHPGAVSQIVEDPVGSSAPEEPAALCAYQHFENLRNFLVAVQDLGIPTFEPSDLQQVACLKEELDGKNKENEMLRKMISSLRACGAGPTVLSNRSRIIPQPKSTKITEAKGRNNVPSLKKSNSYTEDKLSTDSDSSSTWKGSSSSFSNNYNNALNEQDLGPGLVAVEMHASDLSSDSSRHTTPKLVEKKLHEKFKRSSSEIRESKILRNHRLSLSPSAANGSRQNLIPKGRQATSSMGTNGKAIPTTAKTWK